MFPDFPPAREKSRRVPPGAQPEMRSLSWRAQCRCCAMAAMNFSGKSRAFSSPTTTPRAGVERPAAASSSVALADLLALHLLREVPAAALLPRGEEGAAAAQRVGEVVGTPRVDGLPVEAVLVEVVDGRERTVDGNLGEVRPAQPRELGVLVGEVARLEERVVREVDARHDVRGAEGHLLRLREEVRRVAVEHQLAHAAHGDELLGDDLRRVQQLDAQLLRLLLLDDLQAELPLGKWPFSMDSRRACACRRSTSGPSMRRAPCSPTCTSASSRSTASS